MKIAPEDSTIDEELEYLTESILNVCFCVFSRYEFALPKTEPSRTLNNSAQIHIFSSSNGHLITIFASSFFQKEMLA